MAEKEKSSLYLLTIVGIVAVVGIAVLVVSCTKKVTEPDFVITDAYAYIVDQKDVYPERTYPEEGTYPDILHIIITLENQGGTLLKESIISNDVFLTYDIQPEGWRPEHYFTDPEDAAHVIAPAAGASVSGDLTFEIDPEAVEKLKEGVSQTFTFTVTTDGPNEFKESDETNNVYSDTITLTSADVT